MDAIGGRASASVSRAFEEVDTLATVELYCSSGRLRQKEPHLHPRGEMLMDRARNDNGHEVNEHHGSKVFCSALPTASLRIK